LRRLTRSLVTATDCDALPMRLGMFSLDLDNKLAA
jgi:hypothetical protein